MLRTILIGLALAVAPAAAVAQNSLPGLENFTLDRTQLPRPTPTQTPPPTPTPSASPSPGATAVPVPPPAVLASPTPAGTPSPTQRPAATPSRTPAAALSATAPNAAPAAGPVATPTAPVAATATPGPVATAAPADVTGGPTNWALWLGIAAALVALAGGGWWWRRRQAASAAEMWDAPAEPVEPPAPPLPPGPTPTPAPAPAKAPGGLVTTALRPEVVFDLRPVAAGIDALRATVDFELRVTNVGRADAHEVAVESWLIGAGSDPGAELAPLLAQPPGEPLLPPFTLPSSANADLNAQNGIPRELLPTITAGERKLFVPLVVVRATYRDGRGQLATASDAFLIGAAPAGQERLAPLALDRGTRTYRTLAARRFS